MRRLLVFGALALAAPVTAQTTAPVVTAAPLDPARLAIATRLAGRLMPDGTFRKIMTGTLDNIMGSMTKRMMDMPLRDLAGMGGVDAEKLKAIGPGTSRQIMNIMDPAFEQRMQITMKVMTTGLTNMMSTIEPSMREGMAEAYARRFTVAQLGDLERFFSSPTGSFYASQVMELGTDPAIMERTQALFPKVIQAMPAMMKEVEAQTASLPKPRKASDLTDADKKKLAELLGTEPKEAK